MVPGLVASWAVLRQNATLRRRELFRRAIEFARQGFGPSPALRRACRNFSAVDSDWNEVYASLRVGRRLVQTQMARTLRTIAERGEDAFYQGTIGRSIVADAVAKGGLLRTEDLAENHAKVSRPWSVGYRSYRVHTTPPNSQGATALVWLRLLEKARLADASSRRYFTQLLEGMFPAYACRARYIGDPRFTRFPRKLLNSGVGIALDNQPRRYRPGGSDTTAFSIYDGEIGISAIQSNYSGFGAGVTVKGTGINLNNRGSYFTLKPDHHNVVAPRKWTFHTLMAILAVGPDEILLGSMGGDIQPQVNVQVLTRMIDRNQGIQEAISDPRFAYPATIYGTAPLHVEPGISLRGARPVRLWSPSMGQAQGIMIGETVRRGMDPRGDAWIEYPGLRSPSPTR
jgi:gamma-glutamyltranspeptidase/glutathione hydrolase